MKEAKAQGTLRNLRQSIVLHPSTLQKLQRQHRSFFYVINTCLFAYMIYTTYIAFAYATSLKTILPNDVLWENFTHDGLNQALLPGLTPYLLDGSEKDITLGGNVYGLKEIGVTDTSVQLGQDSIFNYMYGKIPLQRFVRFTSAFQAENIGVENSLLCWLDLERSVSLAKSSQGVALCNKNFKENAAVSLEAVLLGADNLHTFFTKWDGALNPATNGQDAGRFNQWKTKLMNKNKEFRGNGKAIDYNAYVSYLNIHGYTYSEQGYHDAHSPGLIIEGKVAGPYGTFEYLRLIEKKYTQRGAPHANRYHWGLAKDLALHQRIGVALYNEQQEQPIYQDGEYLQHLKTEGMIVDTTHVDWYEKTVGQLGSTFQTLQSVPEELVQLKRQQLDVLWDCILESPKGATLLNYHYRARMDSHSWDIEGATFGSIEMTCPSPKWIAYPYWSSSVDACQGPFSFSVDTEFSAFLIQVALLSPDLDDEMHPGHAIQKEKLQELGEWVEQFPELAAFQPKFRELLLKYKAKWHGALRSLIKFENGTKTVIDHETLESTVLPGTYDMTTNNILTAWLEGRLFIVHHEGMVGTINQVQGKMNDDIPLDASSYTPPDGLAQYLRFLCLYASIVCCSVAVLVLFQIFKSRGHIEYFNCIQFNRLVASHWIGRPVTFLRGAVALGILCSARPRLESTALSEDISYWSLTSQANDVLVLIWSSIECVWITYTVTDVVGPFYPYRTRRLKALAAWGAVGVVVMYVFSQEIKMVIQNAKPCEPALSDYLYGAMECDFGTLYLGQPIKLIIGIVIAVASTLLIQAIPLFSGMRLRVKGCFVNKIPEHSMDLLNVHRWVCEKSRIAYIDLATCAMTGHVALGNPHGLGFIFDVMSWKKYFWSPNTLGQSGEDIAYVQESFGLAIGQYNELNKPKSH